LCRVDGAEAFIDKSVENGKAGFLVHRPAKDVAAQYQGFDDDVAASEGAAVHDVLHVVGKLNAGAPDRFDRNTRSAKSQGRIDGIKGAVQRDVIVGHAEPVTGFEIGD